jgi:methylase of polypeptide subunit release factors
MSLGEPPRVWGGGEDGLEVIRRFGTEAGQAGRTLGAILIGINRRSVSQTEVEALAHAQNFTLVSTTKSLHPGMVLAFEPPRQVT